MKSLLPIVIIGLIGPTPAIAQPDPNSLVPRVDERVELLSIAYTLARRQPDPIRPNPTYATAIATHFRRYANHPFIEYLVGIVDSAAKVGGDLGSWEIPSVAVHLSQPPSLEPLVPFHDTGASADSWDNRDLLTPQFVSLLKQFYVDAQAAAFFKSQARYYGLVNARYQTEGIRLNKAWLEQFFSIPTTENYYAVIGLLGIGTGDYLRVNFPNNRRRTHTILGSQSFDTDGMPTDPGNQMVARSSLHEYIHAFTNQLVDQHISQLQKPAEAILADPRVFGLVKDTFYNNWQFLLYESLVRACSIQYLMADRELATSREAEIAAQVKAGFVWMPGLVRELDRYQQDRRTYHNLEAFMPTINRYLTEVAAEITAGTFAFPKR